MHSYLLSALLGLTALGLSAGQLSAAEPAGAAANVHVTLPADAILTIDGSPTQSTSADRWFFTPPFAEGRTYEYTFKAEFVREGKTITVQQKVVVRAGQETNVSLNVPGAAVASTPYTSGVGTSEIRGYYYSPEAATTGISGTKIAHSRH